MSAIDDLKASDTLQIGGISYNLHSPIGDSQGVIGALCLSKDKPLEFALTSEQLALPVGGLRFPFTGVVDVSGTSVTWSVDRDVDAWYSVLHITNVHGQI